MCIRDSLIIAAGSIYGKFESSHKEGEPDVGPEQKQSDQLSVETEVPRHYRPAEH